VVIFYSVFKYFVYFSDFLSIFFHFSLSFVD